MKVRNATLVNVHGRAAKFAGFAIVPADVELAGSSFSPSFPLADVPKDRIPPILRQPIESHYDVAWVRARLPHAFGISPPIGDAEKAILWVGFVAVPDGKDEGLAFWCTDHYGETALMFSDEETDATAKQNAANAFWGLLLSEPDVLEDFEGSIVHLGAPVTLHFGCENGEPFFYETPE